MQPSVSVSVDVPTLHQLHVRLCATTAIDDRKKIVDAMLVHPELQVKLRAAAGVVLKNLAQRSTLLADLLQETTCRLDALLLDGELAFRDEGGVRFSGWFWKVTLSATHRSWLRIRPLWLKNVALISSEKLETLALAPLAEWDLDVLLIAIDRMRDLDAKQIIRESIQGLTFTESARLHAISVSTVSNRWHRGVEELRKNWPDD